MTEAEKIATDARASADYHRDRGALALHELFSLIQRLAVEVGRQGALLAHLEPDKSDDVL